MNFFRKFTLVATALLSIAFIGCSNSSDSSSSDSSSTEWLPVSNKADLIGTWVCDFSSTERVTIVINSNYKGDATSVYDLSSKSQSEIDAFMNKLNNSLLDGGHATYDNTTKKITTIFPIGYDRGYGEGVSLEEFSALVQINSTKDKIRAVENTQAVYTKQ